MVPTRVVLVGPAAPRMLTLYLDEPSAARARAVPGMGGYPVNSLAAALLDRGIGVDLVTLSPGIDHEMSLRGQHLNIFVGPYRTRARERVMDLYGEERKALSRMLALTTGEVVHAHWTYEFALPCLIERRPVVVTAHDAPLSVLLWARDAYRLMRTTLAYRVRFGVQTLTTVSPYLATRWRREMLYRGAIDVIPNIVPPTTVRQRPDRRAETVIVDIAHAGRAKNVRALVEAVALVRREHRGVALRLIGDDLDHDGPVAAWARDRDLADGVRFLGPLSHEQLELEVTAADMLVHPSFEEGHPMAVCEAMAAGLPVVGGRGSGGVPWTLGNGSCGLLVDVRRPAEIGRAISRLVEDPDLGHRLGAAGRDRALTAFSPSAVVNGYTDVYQRVVTRRSVG